MLIVYCVVEWMDLLIEQRKYLVFLVADLGV